VTDGNREWLAALFIGLLLRALFDPNKRKNCKMLGKPVAMATSLVG
jgi:hypothetical protein